MSNAESSSLRVVVTILRLQVDPLDLGQWKFAGGKMRRAGHRMWLTATGGP